MDSEERRDCFWRLAEEAMGASIDVAYGRVEEKRRQEKDTWRRIDELVRNAARHDAAEGRAAYNQIMELWEGDLPPLPLEDEPSSFDEYGERAQPLEHYGFMRPTSMKRRERRDLGRVIREMEERSESNRGRRIR
jgi:hypothetical protein